VQTAPFFVGGEGGEMPPAGKEGSALSALFREREFLPLDSHLASRCYLTGLYSGVTDHTVTVGCNWAKYELGRLVDKSSLGSCTRLICRYVASARHTRRRGHIWTRFEARRLWEKGNRQGAKPKGIPKGLVPLAAGGSIPSTQCLLVPPEAVSSRRCTRSYLRRPHNSALISPGEAGTWPRRRCAQSRFWRTGACRRS
jgi:hypothetical protein